MFIVQVLMGPSKQLKQIIQMEHNIVKNPNWPEANQLAIYKRGRGFEPGAKQQQIQVEARAGLKPGSTAGVRVLTTRPHCLLCLQRLPRANVGLAISTSAALVSNS